MLATRRCGAASRGHEVRVDVDWAIERAEELLGDGAAAAERTVRSAMEIAAIPAPTFDEGARARHIADRIGGGSPDPAGNVTVEVPGARGGAAVALVAHMDTVFPAGVPLSVSRDDARAHGPGIGDNAVAVAALMEVAACLRAHPRPAAAPILVAFTVAEEGRGDLAGARAVIDTHRPRAVLAVEGHYLDRMATAAVGSVRLEAVFSGPGGHSWGDRGAPSATHAAARAAAWMADLARGPDAALSVGILEGGTSVNTIAAGARMEIDLRATDPGELARLESHTRAALAAGADEEGVRLEVREIGRRPGGALAPDHPLGLALRAVRSGIGLPAADESAVSTDANAALGTGVAAAAIGVTRGGGMHTPGEWIETGPIRQGLVMVLASALAIAGHPEG
jgi:acetylornithine deacetylase/succinyl-diaminopimelate desuccinylase-like protein